MDSALARALPPDGPSPRGEGGKGSELQVRRPADERLGVEVLGADVRSLSGSALVELRQLVWDNKLVVLRGQDICAAEYVAFAHAFGRPQIYFQDNYHHPDHPEIFVSSNVEMDGEKVGVAGTGRYWHTDCQFFDQPLPMTMLLPVHLPEGLRETYYIDMERVLATLPEDLATLLAGRRCVHEARWRYKVQACDIDKSITEILEEFGAVTPAVTHPAVITHPVTGKRSLYVSEGFTRSLDGLPHEESGAVMQRLLAFIRQGEHAHTHRWEDGDLLIWDNRPLIHMASTTPKGQRSTSYRIGVYDGQPFYDEPGRRAAG